MVILEDSSPSSSSAPNDEAPSFCLRRQKNYVQLLLGIRNNSLFDKQLSFTELERSIKSLIKNPPHLVLHWESLLLPLSYPSVRKTLEDRVAVLVTDVLVALKGTGKHIAQVFYGISFDTAASNIGLIQGHVPELKGNSDEYCCGWLVVITPMN
ncbi:hypothetical protein FQA39_LY14338 [Lamprigera yunnana]|nr:hypothetical protein FQA39_LY14338 [Lamprigera yunnana]